MRFPTRLPPSSGSSARSTKGYSGINLEFPSDGGSYPKISFSSEDLHEEYLAWFDAHGVSVFLQVEPGFADVPTLIDLVLERYGTHPCVIGFGVDVEWFGNVTEGGEGTPVDDATASSWEEPDPLLRFGLQSLPQALGHLLHASSYRGSIIFVDDGQGYANMQAYLDDMQAWADTFHPNRVFFQYGYESDRPWWKDWHEPPIDGRQEACRTDSPGVRPFLGGLQPVGVGPSGPSSRVHGAGANANVHDRGGIWAILGLNQ